MRLKERAKICFKVLGYEIEQFLNKVKNNSLFINNNKYYS